MMRVFSFFAIFLLFNNSVRAQIGGISASKINAVCVEVVAPNTVEFEPGLVYASSKYFWNGKGTITHRYATADSVYHFSEMYFRVTYGLLEGLEIGGTVSTDLTLAQLGLRYVIWQNKKMGFALMAGTNLPLGNGVINTALKTDQNTISAGVGLVTSVQFNENLSLDFNLEGESFLEKTESKNKGIYMVNADLGYYVFEHQLQFVVGLGYRYEKYETNSIQIVTMYPGVTIETGKDFILVLGFPFDIYGRNSAKNFGVNFALTLTFR